MAGNKTHKKVVQAIILSSIIMVYLEVEEQQTLQQNRVLEEITTEHFLLDIKQGEISTFLLQFLLYFCFFIRLCNFVSSNKIFVQKNRTFKKFR